MAYYWFARGARLSPQFQFLSYYQAIEYYYLAYTQEEAKRRVSKILKESNFRADRQSDLKRVIQACDIRHFSSERDQLVVTLSSCVRDEELRDWINEDEQRKEFLTTKKGGKLSKFSLSLKDTGSNIVEQAARRIYDLRCRIVHTGNDNGAAEANYLVPSSPDVRKLNHDIDMAEFFARNVIVSNATKLVL